MKVATAICFALLALSALLHGKQSAQTDRAMAAAVKAQKLAKEWRAEADQQAELRVAAEDRVSVLIRERKEAETEKKPSFRADRMACKIDAIAMQYRIEGEAGLPAGWFKANELDLPGALSKLAKWQLRKIEPGMIGLMEHLRSCPK